MPPNPFWEFIQSNLNKIIFYFDALSQNPNITWEIVQAITKGIWYYDHLSLKNHISCIPNSKGLGKRSNGFELRWRVV